MAKASYQDAAAHGELLPLPAWASEAVNLINDLASATDLVDALAAQTEAVLAQAGGH